MKILLEAQIDYLTDKYGDQVPVELIQHAIDISRRDAEKLIYGYINRVIDEITPEAVQYVTDLDPFEKREQSQTDLEYKQEIKAAKEVNREYWQWIIRQQKEGIDYIDVSIFDYFEATGIKPNEALEISYDEAKTKSDEWHHQEFANQEKGGQYKYGIDTQGTVEIDGWYFVPLIVPHDYKIEGTKMQNCISDHMVSKSLKIISMRNKFNNPKVSISIRYNTDQRSTIEQIKGKQNKIPILRYQKIILKWILNSKFDNVYCNDFAKILEESDPKLINQFIKSGQIELSDKLIEKFGKSIEQNAIDKWASNNSFGDKIAALLPVRTAIILLQNKHVSSSSIFLNLIDRIPQDIAQKLSNSDFASRYMRVVYNVRYNPEQFIQELSAIDPEDTAKLIDKYLPTIIIYNGRHHLFTEILIALLSIYAKHQVWSSTRFN